LQAIHIRQAEREDFQWIYQFVNELENQVFDEEKQYKIYLENTANPDHIYLLANIGSLPVGFLSCHVQNLLHHGGLVGEIQEMYVIENARNLGVGKKLTDRLKEIAAEKNVLQIEVTSSFKRESAHRFYQRERFEHTHKKFVYRLKPYF
jgi:PhnO protein